MDTKYVCAEELFNQGTSLRKPMDRRVSTATGTCVYWYGSGLCSMNWAMALHSKDEMRT